MPTRVFPALRVASLIDLLEDDLREGHTVRRQQLFYFRVGETLARTGILVARTYAGWMRIFDRETIGNLEKVLESFRRSRLGRTARIVERIILHPLNRRFGKSKLDV